MSNILIFTGNYSKTKNKRENSLIIFVAEARGFEPPIHCCIHDFESCAFNHSATLPLYIIAYFITKEKDRQLRGKPVFRRVWSYFGYFYFWFLNNFFIQELSLL